MILAWNYMNLISWTRGSKRFADFAVWQFCRGEIFIYRLRHDHCSVFGTVWSLFYSQCRKYKFYIRGSVHHSSRLKKSKKMQQYADIYLFTAKLLYMFRATIAPIIRSTENCSCSPWYRSYYLGSKLPQTWPNKDWFGTVGTVGTVGPNGPNPVLIWSRLRKLASQIVWSVPGAATTVFCTPDDGRDGRPKHV